MNKSIDVLDFFVKKEFLYDMDLQYVGLYERCKIIGIGTYLHDTPTFSIITEKNGLYSYIPFHALKSKMDHLMEELDINDLVYHNCHSIEIDICKFSYLVNLTPSCYFKRKNIWMNANYLFTVDFYMGNDLLHVMQLMNGQLCALPSHKINWNGDNELPDYKKCHQIWKI